MIKINMKPPQPFHLPLMVAFALAPTAWVHALDLTITNRSFENPAVSDNGINYIVPPGWSGQGTLGVANPANGFFPGTTDGSPGPNPIDGFNAVSINSGGKVAYQDVNALQANWIYKLTVLAGQRSDAAFGNGSVSLWAGTNLLIEGIPNPSPGTFIPFSLSYTSPPTGSAIGKLLRIELAAPSGGSQTWWDNVHLFAEPFVCTPHKAVATAQLFNGVFVGATIIDPGCGYSNPPPVTISGGGGNGAAATAVLVNDRVTELRVTSGGCCYTNPPTIVIESPPRVPMVAIRISKVVVTEELTLGRRYVLESSFDLNTWTAIGAPFTAMSETIEGEYDVSQTGRFFRVREAP